MTTRVTASEVQAHLSEYVRCLARGGERIVVENDGEPEAALIGLEDLQRLEALDRQAREDADLAARQAAFRRGLEEDGISVQWSSGPPVDWSERELVQLSGQPLSEQIIEERSQVAAHFLDSSAAVKRYDSSMMRGRLEVGFLLDQQWRLLHGEMEITKRPALLALARVLSDAATPYAIIGGVALQIHQTEPRTTLDIDLAVADLDAIPRAELRSAGFMPTGEFTHSENWLGPGGVPVQFTADPTLGAAIERALEIEVDGVPIRVIARSDLLHEKIRAGSDSARRRSKRLQDLADVQALIEETPELRSQLSAQERAVLDALPD